MHNLVAISNVIIAQAQGPGAMEQLMGMVVPLAIVFFIFWILIWRPQNKQRQEHDQYLNQLSVDDEIVTVGGIIGRIKAIESDIVTIEISKGAKMKILRRSVQGAKSKILGEDKENKEESDSSK